jgi:hypothetical protein
MKFMMMGEEAIEECFSIPIEDRYQYHLWQANSMLLPNTFANSSNSCNYYLTKFSCRVGGCSQGPLLDFKTSRTHQELILI